MGDRVLLVQAFTALDMELVYPIGLSYLAAHLPVQYDRYALTPALAPRADELQAAVETDAVINAALGVEWRVSDRWPLRFGLFSNRTAAGTSTRAPPPWPPPRRAAQYASATAARPALSSTGGRHTDTTADSTNAMAISTT